MKPLVLSISAWGPYKNEEQIHFDTLGKNGLFLITGPTGAGKTTIFDGISYALFGDVSGEVRQKDKKENLRSDFADDSTKTYVQLEFEHRGKRYTVYRQPKYLRKKKNGTGYTPENEEVNLYEEEEIIASGTKEVNLKIKDLLSIDYRQFKQIVMIAQGEFQSLLMAGSKERTAIFRDIFQTGLYESMQNLLSKKSRQLEKDIGEIRQGLDQAVSTVETSLPQWEELMAHEIKPYEDMLKLLLKVVREDEKKESQIRLTLDTISQTKRDLVIRIDVQKKMQKKADQLEGAVKTLNELEDKKTGIQELQQKVCQLKKIEHIARLEEKYISIKKEFEKEKENREFLKEKASEIKEMKKALDVQLKNQEDMEKELETCRMSIPELEQMAQKWKSLDKELERLEVKQADYLLWDKKTKVSKGIYEEKEDRLKKAAAGLLAAKLQPGIPCPVCGSIEHPLLAKTSEEMPTEQEVQRLKHEYETNFIKTNKKQQKAVESNSLVNSLKKELEQTTKEYENVKILLGQIAKRKIRMNQLGIEIQMMNEKKHGLDIETEANKRQLQDADRRIVQLYEDLGKAQSLYVEKLSETKIESDTYEVYKKELNRIDSYEKEINRFNQDIKWQQNVKLSLEKELETYEKEDQEALLDTLKAEEDLEREQNKEKDSLIGRLKVNEKAIHFVRKEWKRHKDLSKEYGIIKDLDNIAKGRNLRNLVFEQYILSVYFDEIILAANLRLTVMTNNRYELYRVTEAGDARTKESLDLEVLDRYTGKARSVKSLSGGEIFKASLSLALGMSDVIQNSAGGIEIDTLFIDEGFGALDQESLDHAMNALYQLVSDNRLIGIISHVEELKERVDSQIVIETSRFGSKIKTS